MKGRSENCVQRTHSSPLCWEVSSQGELVLVPSNKSAPFGSLVIRRPKPRHNQLLANLKEVGESLGNVLGDKVLSRDPLPNLMRSLLASQRRREV